MIQACLSLSDSHYPDDCGDVNGSLKERLRRKFCVFGRKVASLENFCFFKLQERLREKIEAENEAKAEIQRTMSRAMAEAQIWKAKYTTEAVARIEDLENARSKLLVRKISGTISSCIGTFVYESRNFVIRVIFPKLRQTLICFLIQGEDR